MRIIRFLANLALWLGALLGIVAGGVWVADQFGWVQPLIVVSGSMEPAIDTDDLLISRNLATADVEVGDVISLRSEITDKLVTHRVTEVAPNDDGTWTISMKGDANDEPDLETYTVDSSVLTPALRIPQGGKVLSKLLEPAVALPILLSLVAVVGISLLDERSRPKAGSRRKRAEASLYNDSTDGVAPGAPADAGSEGIGVDSTELDPLADLDAALASIGAVVDASDLDGVGDSDTDSDSDQDVDLIVDDLDAALAALGIDIGQLPADPSELSRTAGTLVP